MHELREMFGSIYYSIYFIVSDIAKVEGLTLYVLDIGYYRAKATSVEEMRRVSNAIVTAGGSVERIESHYPSLEEMLVKIGA